MKKLAKFFSLLIVAILFSPTSIASAGEYDEILTQKIDSIFQKWDNDYSPGAAVAIMKDGEVIFKKVYGMANLEYDIPITPSSIFNIASISKQYTAFCIALLAQENKLSLDDDIRKYLSEIPDFGEVITIKNLIHHTSGLRDQGQLMAIIGRKEGIAIEQDDIIKLVERQKRLNFKPNDRYLYSNTGYTLLAEIVEKVSGKTLRDYADEIIFKPLDMHSTFFYDDYTEIVKNRTYSYSPKDSITYRKSISNNSYVGASNLYTTIGDHVKWLNNFKNAQVGGKDVIEQMQEVGILNNGDTLNYAFGLVIGKYNGLKSIGHGGSSAGFRSNSVYYPEKEIGIVIFSNASNDTGLLGMKLSDMLLGNKTALQNEGILKKIDKTNFKDHLGNYISDEGFHCMIFDSTKLYIKYKYGIGELSPVSEVELTAYNGREHFRFNKSNPMILEFQYLNYPKSILKKYDKPNYTIEELQKFVGSYYNEETETKYGISLIGEKLQVSHKIYETVMLKPLKKDQFSCPNWWMNNIIFQRNINGEVIGFEINCDRVLHLFFKKES